MAIFEMLTPAEQARQLSNPEGAIGLAVADWLNENNKQASARNVAALGVEAGDRVLEIGFGNGRAAPEVIAQAAGVRYSGIDISPTMVAEASAFNAALVATGRTSFQLGSAECMPFADHVFDRVFSVGVIHFWKDPAASLVEVRRTLRFGGTMRMTCLASQEAPNFAQAEYGFHLRDVAEWDALCRAAGFTDVHADMFSSQQTTGSGAPTKRYAITVMARA
ncbi:class I SAM-dependent methyltransferase [Mesorhizobium sp. ORM8.1]